jgi:tRNA uridine 5-carboxymethylaminomethyl modification enzyme
MIDDLTSRGVTEPYRMFTSRAEYRLTLRADNADARLTPVALELGCISAERNKRFTDYREMLDSGRSLLQSLAVTPTEARKAGLNLNLDGQRRSAYELLSYPEYGLGDLVRVWNDLGSFSKRVAEALEIEASYSVYMDRQAAAIEIQRRDESRLIPDGFDYSTLSGLSNELKNKLGAQKPSNIAQAMKVDGMTPAAISLLLVHIRRRQDGGKHVA